MVIILVVLDHDKELMRRLMMISGMIPYYYDTGCGKGRSELASSGV